MRTYPDKSGYDFEEVWEVETQQGNMTTVKRKYTENIQERENVYLLLDVELIKDKIDWIYSL